MQREAACFAIESFNTAAQSAALTFAQAETTPNGGIHPLTIVLGLVPWLVFLIIVVLTLWLLLGRLQPRLDRIEEKIDRIMDNMNR